MNDSPGTIAVLAEKPSVARDIAQVLGATVKGENYLHGNGYIVTWAVGHLAALAQPHEINPSWKQWRRDTLPMLPQSWPLVIYEKTKDQFATIKKIINSPKVARIVCATDAGREGELIFRYIYEAAECGKPVDRLWISSLTPDAIRKGFDTLKPAFDYNGLADAARGRSRADWLVGMNLSRAYSLTYGGDISVGRVQTPTLAIVVERELLIRNFVADDYMEVAVTFRPSEHKKANSYKGTWFRPQAANAADKESMQKSMRLAPDGVEGNQIAARARTGTAAIESIKAETQRMAPPFFYDLTELQRHANRLFGFSAQKTLDVAQALYESHKLISYPRTDSRHISADVATTLPNIVRKMSGPYAALLAPGTGEKLLGRRYVDDTKVTDHYAIIPTAGTPKSNLTADEAKLYDLICRRLLSAWHEDHIWSVTTVITKIETPDAVDRYHSSGTAVRQVGWKVLDVVVEKKSKKPKGDEAEQVLPAVLDQGQAQDVLDVEELKKKTRAPKRLTVATLLTAMETAGKTLDEKELSDAMKETGLGTPATRASIIEVLLKREYIIRDGKNLEATEKGIQLIAVVHPEVKSPIMTGQWEAYLKRVQRGEARLDNFLTGIEDYVREVVGKASELTAVPRTPVTPAAVVPPTANEPVPVRQSYDSIEQLLSEGFGFDSFRANQEAVCRAVIKGDDVLLVMPTGSGKSLCYQLPGVIRGGTTLVISPLIALMEDQVAKLKQRGFAVERIHSGRDRAASRQTCIDYLNGKLQFLFIAPERLRVAGFPEMLAKRKPSLIAIDEAHCISQWGHDFRPDYRMFGQHLPSLRPAPVIALTATATAVVQKDIAAQLGLMNPDRFIHGFRRDNLAIEVVEVAPKLRSELVLELLGEGGQSAIVYAPTRKQVEYISKELSQVVRAAGYHAGLDAGHRQRVQEKFLSGEIDVMVATIAFGMGIDKPNVRTVIHTALPGSIEGYYQEIGRAGRDGLPSRAILMHSYADRFTHDFFFERDYPDVKLLDQIFATLSDQPTSKDQLQRMLRIDPDMFDKALEKLWIHGGAMVDFAENATLGTGGWRDAYIAHGQQRREQIETVMRFASKSHCRMSTLVRHFGDLADSHTPCGICDFCAPDNCVAQRFRKPTAVERKAMFRVFDDLRSSQSKSTGKLHSDIFPHGDLSRDDFEEVLGAMARLGLIALTDAVFEKEGKQIPYRKAAVTRLGQSMDETSEIDLMVKAPLPTKGKKAAPKKGAPVKKQAPVDKDGIAIEARLRAWRLAEAKRRKVPAFRIFSDQVLRALADRRPKSTAELLAVPGMGIKLVESFGASIFRLVNK